MGGFKPRLALHADQLTVRLFGARMRQHVGALGAAIARSRLLDLEVRRGLVRLRRVGQAAMLLLLMLLSTPASAQWYAQRIVAASITTSGSDCTTATACVTLADGDAARRFYWTVQLTGTWTGTAQFEATADGTTWAAISMTPAASTTTVTSSAATGLWTTTGTLQGVRVRASALSSGTIVSTILSR